MRFTGPTRPKPISVLTVEQLTQEWYADLDRFDPHYAGLARRNEYQFPLSRYDLIIEYNRRHGHDVSGKGLRRTSNKISRPGDWTAPGVDEIGAPIVRPSDDSSTRVLRSSSSYRRGEI